MVAILYIAGQHARRDAPTGAAEARAEVLFAHHPLVPSTLSHCLYLTALTNELNICTAYKARSSSQAARHDLLQISPFGTA
eukprot:1889283-Pleurochrysis_carterae.AAC.2